MVRQEKTQKRFFLSFTTNCRILVAAINFGRSSSTGKRCVSTVGGKPLAQSKCESCGECVERCPTGAFSRKNSRRPAREVKTICPYCGVGCGIYLGVRGDQVVSVRGDRENPANNGQLCVKGRFGYHFINHRDRLSTPLIKKDGVLTEATWDEALDLAANKFQQTKKTFGPDALAAVSSARCTTVEKYTPEFVEEITGVPADNLITAARLFGAAGNAAILYCMGVTQQTSGTDNVLALANLSLATGNIGKPYAGLNPLRGQNNVQGACDMGALPVVLTGYQPIASEEVRAKFSQSWGLELSSKPGLTMTEIFDAAIDKKIRALYVMGENPLLTEPNVNHTRESIEALDFLVVQDIFLTETAQLADVVLPAASFAEKDGTFVNTERRVQRVRRAVRPRGQSKPDWEICQLLAEKLGFDWGYASAAEIFAEISRLTPSYGGISYERLEAGGLQWPCPTPDHPGTPILHVGQFARGLGKFSAVEYRPAAEEMDGEFPFLLTTGRSLYQYHTGTMTGKSEGLTQFHREELMEINPDDAARLNINDGDVVKVVSRRGTVRSKVKITENIKRGVLFMTFHFAETAANLLTNPQLCPKAKTPELKVCAVRVEKTNCHCKSC